MKIALTVALLTAATFVTILVLEASNQKELLDTARLFHLRQSGNTTIEKNATLSASSSSSSSSSSGGFTTASFTNEEIIAMRQRLAPRELVQVDQTILPHQFLHRGTCKL
jgi:hypothetical protein